MIRSWVIGGGGLLGSALCRALRDNVTEGFSPPERFCWRNKQKLASQLASAVQQFAAQVGTADRWEIYWAAGVGAMSSTADELAPETQALSVLLRLIESQPQLIARPGSLALASSAGAVYAGAADEIISENTPPAPTTAYAHEKLRQESLVHSFARANREITALNARISTLYGPGQSLGKKQGLLTHIARCILRNQPIKIFVPFDTIRDYIAADDAASAIIAAVRKLDNKSGILTKIIASEQPTSIAEIISIFKRIARRPPRIITSATPQTELYARRVQFRSLVALDSECAPRISLAIGISQVLAGERAAYVRSAPEDLL